MKTKEDIDRIFDDIMWSRDLDREKYPLIATINLAYPTQLAYDCLGGISQETILKAMIIAYHKQVNELFREKVEQEMMKPIRVLIRSNR